MPPAIIGGAIAGIGAIGAAAIGSKASSKATQAAQQGNDQAMAMQRDIYNQNAATLSPYVQAGLPATGAINALLGLTPTQSYQTTGTQQQNALAPMNDAENPSYQPYISEWTNPRTGQVNWGGLRAMYGGGDPYGTPDSWKTGQWGAQPMAAAGQPTQQQAQNGFDLFRNSTGYKFRLDQGMNALNSGYAGAGTLQSGAAMKAAVNYGQNLASGEFGNYLNALSQQQGVGLQAAGAQAGVGVQYANTAGSLAQQNGENLANAALIKGQQTGQLVNSLATIGANIAGGWKK